MKLHAVTASAAAVGLLVLASGATARPPARAVAHARDQLERTLGPGAVLRANGRTGTVRALGRLDGPLTPASGAPPQRVALDYVRANRTALGLDAADVDALRLTRGPVRAGGLVQLRWGQQVDGLPVARATLRATLDGSGRLRALAGKLLSGVTLAGTEPAIAAADAYRRVRGGAPAPARRAAGRERSTTFRDGGSASLVAARAGGRDRLAWRVLAPVDSRHFYDALVDAASGGVLERFNRVRDAGAFAHFDYFPGATSGGSQATTQAPAGWISDPVADSPLSGPNVHAVLDPDDVIPGFSGSATEAPADADGNWVQPLDVAPDGSTWDPGDAGSWTVNANHSAAQLFWFVNRFHDHLAAAPISFDAASGAFQGADAIVAQAMDGAAGIDDEHFNNANFLTLPDGQPGYMQVYLWGEDFATVDGADDASLVYHEYGHGLSGRLVTYADGVEAMWNPGVPGGGQAAALGEGTSDWYALDYLVGASLLTDSATAGDVRLGEYLDPADTGALRFEGVDCTVGGACPGTADAGPGGFDYSDYGSVIGFAESHSDGEIWAQTLWDVRRALIAAHPDGLTRARSYITGGLRLAPPEPNFLELRDAILQAAALGFGGADVALLRSTFAARGMGWSATVGPGDSATAGFDLAGPGVVTGGVAAVGQGTATVTGSINPAGSPTSYRFQYGITTGYGSSSPTTAAGAGATAVTVRAALSSLEPATTYHYRLVAVRGARVTAGGDRTFTTPALPGLQPPGDPPGSGSDGTATIARKALTADRRGRFRVSATFAADAALGTARLTVARRGKRLAVKSFAVEPGTVTVRMRLTRTGRRVIRRHRSRLVTLALQLPSGARVTAQVKLARR